MSEARVLVSESDESEAGEFLIRRLPPWMPIAADTGNFKLLDVVGRAIDRIDGDLQNVENAQHVQDAETIAQIRELAKLVETPPKDGESLSKYRKRVFSEFQTVTSEGTIKDVLSNAAALLEIGMADIQFSKVAHGTIELRIPGNALDNSSITSSEFVKFMEKHSAAGFSVESTVSGTFTYITPTVYNNNNHDPSKGYDGLDGTGSPKDNGGTYAGLIG